MATTAAKTTLNISSPAFENGGFIPRDFTCEGHGKNPPLKINGLPQNTKSVVLIVDDPDAPGKTFDHWVVWDIPAVETIAQDSIPGMVGRNSMGKNQYTGPCPPSGTHRYFFKVYALDTLLHLENRADKKAVMDALQNHVLAYGKTIGLFKKKNT